MSKPEKLFLIDGNSYIYRAFYAIRHLSNSSGMPTNAIYGFTTMILKVINDYKPAYLAIVFDAKGPTFRSKIYSNYKANRPAMADELVTQIPYIKNIVEAFNIPQLEKPGFEADDIIGTISRLAEQKGITTVIITGDKDMTQLVSEKITLLDTMKDKTTGVAEIKERFGVTPDKVIDIFALAGDATDNIPGISGIGEKTAIELIKEFGNLETLLKEAGNIKKEKLREKVIAHPDDARLSKELFTIKTDVPLPVKIDELKQGSPNIERLRTIFTELEFGKFLKELTPAKNISYDEYRLILDEKDFNGLIDELEKADEFAVDLETTSKDPVQAEIVGISLCHDAKKSFYIPVGHTYPDVPKQLNKGKVLKAIKPLLENPAIRKIGQNIKFDMIIFKRHGLEIKGEIGDTMIASYLLNPAKHNHGLEEISREYLQHQVITYKDVAGTGKKEITFDKVPLEIARDYSAEDANAAYLLDKILIPKLEEASLYKLYNEIELPLVKVLARMELGGIRVNRKFLSALADDFNKRLDKLKREIYRMAEEEFNIDSPKQLQHILYDKLGLQRGKKIKTGFSTDSDTLLRLANEHPLPAQILEYRTIAKLKSTYADGMDILINPQTGRLHTSYNQTITATGRLSSSEPNLQNIPVRTEEGRKIRQAFIPEKGCVFISADYSQIELRLLAHFSKDKKLIEAFENDEDIHTFTATEIFNVTSDLVTNDMRRAAKTINFGIIYGMSAYGLAQQLSISNEMAGQYIESYFARYPEIKDYMEETVISAREKGYVETLFGRKRYLPELASYNTAVRNFAERAAVNTPLQGTAADIMKKAMINLDNRLSGSKLKTKMVLQVHDELIFEAPEEEEKKIIPIIKNEMQNTCKLSVFLKVDLKRGDNWSEMEPVKS
jgi:DNA polymerase-1